MIFKTKNMYRIQIFRLLFSHGHPRALHRYLSKAAVDVLVCVWLWPRWTLIEKRLVSFERELCVISTWQSLHQRLVPSFPWARWPWSWASSSSWTWVSWALRWRAQPRPRPIPPRRFQPPNLPPWWLGPAFNSSTGKFSSGITFAATADLRFLALSF